MIQSPEIREVCQLWPRKAVQFIGIQNVGSYIEGLSRALALAQNVLHQGMISDCLTALKAKIKALH